MAYETIVAAFDTRALADNAVKALRTGGFSSAEISILDKDRVFGGKKGMNEDQVFDGKKGMMGAKERDLWQRLLGRDPQQHEAAVYRKTIEGNGVLVSARIVDKDMSRANAILERHRAAHGAAGSGMLHDEKKVSAPPQPMQPQPMQQKAPMPPKPAETHERAAPRPETIEKRVMAAPAPMQKPMPPKPMEMHTPPPAPVQKAVVPKPAEKHDDEVLHLAEEQLDIGKKQVESGRTRVRRFVTEHEAAAEITLHHERAEVKRRPIDDPKFNGTVDWADKVIEVVETSEQAEVNKTVRFVEEVALKKVGSDHVETVKDKVRRQHVEIERLGPDGKVIPEVGSDAKASPRPAGLDGKPQGIRS